MKFFLNNIVFIRRLIIIVIVVIIIIMLIASRCSATRIRMLGNLQIVEII